MHSRVMRHGYLGHPEAGLFELLGHFDTDDTTSGFQSNLFENVAAEESEVAVDVADRQSECPPHRAPIQGSYPDPIPRIGALDLVSIDQIDVRLEVGQKIVKFADVVLAVSVGVEDQVFPGVAETCDQGCAVTEVSLMMDNSQKRQFYSELIENRACFVLASVVNDEHLEI